MSPTKATVLVLAGGYSAERDVSLESAHGIAGALIEAGYRVPVYDPGRPEVEPSEDHDVFFSGIGIGETPPEIDVDPVVAHKALRSVLAAYRDLGIDVVFSGLHGGAGEDGRVQAMMEEIGVAFTGSGAEACRLAMDKQRAKDLAAAAGVAAIPGVLLERSALGAGTLEQTVRETVGLPAIIKPNAQGSSVGLTRVDDFVDVDRAAAAAFASDDRILVEKYIEGREITQAFLDGLTGIPPLEIRPKSGFYDYLHKYQAGMSEYIVPAPLDPEVTKAVQQSAAATREALGLRDYGRIDFRLAADGTPFLLEANTLPGMTATSLVPKSCKAVGVDYTMLCDRIVQLALRRAS